MQHDIYDYPLIQQWLRPSTDPQVQGDHWDVGMVVPCLQCCLAMPRNYLSLDFHYCIGHMVCQLGIACCSDETFESLSWEWESLGVFSGGV